MSWENDAKVLVLLSIVLSPPPRSAEAPSGFCHIIIPFAYQFLIGPGLERIWACNPSQFNDSFPHIRGLFLPIGIDQSPFGIEMDLRRHRSGGDPNRGDKP